jgi:hypothetical protein
MAKQLLATVATYCRPGAPLLLEADDHRPDPQAILTVFGQVCHRRRRHGHGRRKQPGLKPPPGLLVGIVKKLRDASGHLLGVKTRRLFGRLEEIRRRIAKLKLGKQLNTAHIERLNGTLRTQQTRLARRTRNVSRGEPWLQWALWLWRDLYHWTRLHTSLHGQSPAMALGLSEHTWSVLEYVCYAVHVSPLQRDLWSEMLEKLLTDGLYRKKRLKLLPTS